MQVLITGKQIDVGEALRTHVEDRLTIGVGKYFDRAIDAHVVFSRQGPRYRVDCAVHVGAGINVQSHAEVDEIYASFDVAADRIEKRLRRYKRRLRNHHKAPQGESLPAQAYVIEAEAEDAVEPENAHEFQPVIVAEASTEIAQLTVGEAVMRMDLANLPAMMFRNSGHGGLNVVYRRPDGNIGWIDPQEPDRTP
jgi:ribosomal subunit interface protein